MFNSLVYTSAVRPLFKENSKLVLRAYFQGSCAEQIVSHARQQWTTEMSQKTGNHPWPSMFTAVYSAFKIWLSY